MYFLKAFRNGVSTFEQTFSDHTKFIEMKAWLEANGFATSYEYMRVLS